MHNLNLDFEKSYVSNAAMARRRQLNFFLPVEIVEAFEAISGPKKGKQKWLYGSAAVLLLLAESDSTIEMLKGRIGAASATDKFGELLADIEKAKKRGRGRGGVSGLIPGLGVVKSA